MLESNSNFAVGMDSVRGKKKLARCVARLNKEGRWVWCKDLKSPDEDGTEKFGVCRLQEGFCWVAGLVQSKKKEDAPVDLFIKKLDPSGKAVVDILVKAKGNAKFHAIGTAKDGGCVLALEFSQTITLGKFTVKPDKGPILIFAFVSSKGEFTLVNRVVVEGDFEICAICPDAVNGNWFAGCFDKKIEFGPYTAEAEGNRDVFLVHTNTDGTFDKYLSFYSEGGLTVTGICPDGSGGCWVGGHFSGAARIGETHVGAPKNTDAYAQRALPEGRWGPLYTTAEDGERVNLCAGICSDGFGGCIFAINQTNALSIRDPNVKHASRVLQLGTTAKPLQELKIEEDTVYLESVAFDTRGKFFLGGTFMDKCKLGDKSLWSKGDTDIFFAFLSLK